MPQDSSVVQQWARAVAEKDWDAAADALTEDATFNLSGRHPASGEYRGRDEIVSKMLPALDRLYDRIEVEVHDVLTSDDHVVALFRRTVHRGDRSIQVRAVGVYHVRDGKIQDAWVVEGQQYEIDEFASS